MRPRKPRQLDTDVQVNLRIDEGLRRRLVASAEAHRASFAHEVRARLADSYDTKSLANFLAEFERDMRDIVEHIARTSGAKDIEDTWRRLASVRAKLYRVQTDIEEALMPYMTDPRLRERVRGAQQDKGGKL